MLRPFEPGDLTAARELCAAALDRDDRPEEVADLLLTRSTARAVVAVEDGHIVGCAAGVVRSCASVHTGHLDLVAVHPSAHRRGVGRALVDDVESWCRDRGAVEVWWGNDAPTYAWPGVDDACAAAGSLAVSTGYEPARTAHNCTVDLAHADLATSADERRLAAAGITVERLDARELAAAHSFIATFGGTWTAEVAQAGDHDPSRCHIARRGSSYVGFACHGANRTGWFGPMGTAESERGNGIGAVLLRRCLAEQRDAGLREAQIAWVGPTSFYERTVGAVVDRRFTLYRKEFR